MTDDRKSKLLALGAEALADALLSLADRDEAADDLVERMIALPEENIDRFKTKLSSLKRSRRFIGWGGSASFARELSALLEDLRAGVEDPQAGVQLVAQFFEADNGALGNCDDSSGHVGDVFRFDAKELFVAYASRCPDKNWLGDLVFKLSKKDDYGVRFCLVESAREYLPEPVMRALIDRFLQQAAKEKVEHGVSTWTLLVESLARQLKDAKLFEQTRLASWGLVPHAFLDIARVYLESGDAPSALGWLERIPADEGFRIEERDALLLEVHGHLGNTEQQAEVAWRIFRRNRSLRTLEQLLNIIGVQQREAVLAGEEEAILTKPQLSMGDALFLMEVGRIESAEQYLLTRADQLNGDNYQSLVPLAEAMENHSRPLTASILYRALLDSILRRAQSRIYGHGVRYLKKLDRLAKAVEDWAGQGSHADYVNALKQNHGRKRGFWSKYGE